MIFDGRWKRELQKLSWEITFWRKMTMFGHIAEHRLNRAILYSAIILRKILEEETETEKTITAFHKGAMNVEDFEDMFRSTGVSEEFIKLIVESSETPSSFVIAHCMVKVVEFPYIEKEDQIVRGKLFATVYGTGKKTTLELNKVCNQLVHSYVWTLAHDDTEKDYSGFSVSSDKFRGKVVCFVSFDEWLRTIKTAIEKSIV